VLVLKSTEVLVTEKQETSNENKWKPFDLHLTQYDAFIKLSSTRFLTCTPAHSNYG
jgi:hypothetical protein